MPKDQYIVDEVGTRELLKALMAEEANKHSVPVLDDFGNFTGSYYDRREETPAGQPDQQKVLESLAFLRQKGILQSNRYTGAPGRPIPGLDLSPEPFESEGFFDSIGNTLKLAANQSLEGMATQAITGETVFDIENFRPNWAEKLGGEVLSFFSPAGIGTMALGGGLGGILTKKIATSFMAKELLKKGVAATAAKATAKKILTEGAETVVEKEVLGLFQSQAARVGGRILSRAPASAGSLGAFESVATPLAKGIERGEMELGDIMQDAFSGLIHGGALGASLGVSGGLVPGTGVGSAIGRFAAEVGVFGSSAPVVEGRAPTWNDYIHAAEFLTAMKVAHKVAGLPFKPRGIKAKAEQMQREADKTGKTFNEVIAEKIESHLDKLDVETVAGISRSELDGILAEVKADIVADRQRAKTKKSGTKQEQKFKVNYPIKRAQKELNKQIFGELNYNVVMNIIKGKGDKGRTNYSLSLAETMGEVKAIIEFARLKGANLYLTGAFEKKKPKLVTELMKAGLVDPQKRVKGRMRVFKPEEVGDPNAPAKPVEPVPEVKPEPEPIDTIHQVRAGKSGFPEKPVVGGRERGYVPPKETGKEAYVRGVYLDTDAGQAIRRRKNWEMEGATVQTEEYSVKPGKTLDASTKEGLAELHSLQERARKMDGDFQDNLTNLVKERGYRIIKNTGLGNEKGELVALYSEDVTRKKPPEEPPAPEGKKKSLGPIEEIEQAERKNAAKHDWPITEEGLAKMGEKYKSGEELADALEKKYDNIPEAERRGLTKWHFNIDIPGLEEYVPKAPEPKPEPPKPVEPAPEPKPDVAETPKEAVQEIVEGKKESSLGTKEFKKKMLAELDKAIESAPERSEQAETALKLVERERKFLKREVKGSQRQNSAAQAGLDKQAAGIRERAGIGTVTIQIPGDGIFTIENTKQALAEVRKKVKGLSELSKSPTSADRPLKTAFGGEGLKEGIQSGKVEFVPNTKSGRPVFDPKSQKTQIANIVRPKRGVVGGGGSEFAQQRVKAVDVHPEVSAFVWKFPDVKEYSVTEATSGARFGSGKTATEAITKAKEAIDRVGIKHTKKVIKDLVKKNGPANDIAKPLTRAEKVLAANIDSKMKKVDETTEASKPSKDNPHEMGGLPTVDPVQRSNAERGEQRAVLSLGRRAANAFRETKKWISDTSAFLKPAEKRIQTSEGELVQALAESAQALRSMLDEVYSLRAKQAGLDLNKLSKEDRLKLSDMVERNDLGTAEFRKIYDELRERYIAVHRKWGDTRPDNEILPYNTNFLNRKVRSDVRELLANDIVQAMKALEGVSEGKEDAALLNALKANNMRKLGAKISKEVPGFKGKPVLLTALEHAVKNNKKVKSLKAALLRLRSDLQGDMMFPEYSSEKARTLELPSQFYERDFGVLLPDYIEGFSKRIAEINYFGPKGEVALKLLERIKKKDFVEAQLVQKLLEMWTGAYYIKNPLHPALKKVFDVYTAIEVALKIGLGRGTLLNMSQWMISFMPQAGIWNTAAAGYDIFSPRKRLSLKRAGMVDVYAEHALNAVAGNVPGGFWGDVARFTTKWSGFTAINRMNLYWAAATYKRAVRQWGPQARGTGRMAELRRKQLAEFGIDYRKDYTDSQLAGGMYKFATNSQLQKNIWKEPVMFNEQKLRPLFLFKRFGYRQATWIYDMLKKETLPIKYGGHGNFGPLARLILAGGAGGAGISWALMNVKELLSGEPQYVVDDNIAEKALRHLSLIGAFGVASDFLELEKLSGLARKAKFAIYPVFMSDIEKVFDSYTRTMQDWENYGDGWLATKRNAYRVGGFLGSYPSYASQRLKTVGQKKGRLQFKRNQMKQDIFDAILDGKSASSLIELWNKNFPTLPFSQSDISMKEIVKYLKRQIDKKVAVDTERGTPEFRRRIIEEQQKPEYQRKLQVLKDKHKRGL